MNIEAFKKDKFFKKVMNDLITTVENYNDTFETYNQFIHSEEDFIQKSILNNSDIIFTTLSSSGVSILDEIDQYKREYPTTLSVEDLGSTALLLMKLVSLQNCLR